MKEKHDIHIAIFNTGDREGLINATFLWPCDGYTAEYWYDKEYNVYDGVVFTVMGTFGVQGSTLDCLAQDIRNAVAWLEANHIRPV